MRRTWARKISVVLIFAPLTAEICMEMVAVDGILILRLIFAKTKTSRIES